MPFSWEGDVGKCFQNTHCFRYVELMRRRSTGYGKSWCEKRDAVILFGPENPELIELQVNLGDSCQNEEKTY